MTNHNFNMKSAQNKGKAATDKVQPDNKPGRHSKPFNVKINGCYSRKKG
ncbi:MAG: hypothetical protein VXW22_12725 [Pseudomonadota bacterium]|nr:hypothetical protein [Pseudomonadota bacterium]